MPRYRVTVRRDAWINYTAELEAASAEDAATIARKAFWKEDSAIVFKESGVVDSLDHVECDPDDCEEVKP